MAWKGRYEGNIVGVLLEVVLIVAKEDCGETAGNSWQTVKWGANMGGREGCKGRREGRLLH